MSSRAVQLLSCPGCKWKLVLSKGCHSHALRASCYTMTTRTVLAWALLQRNRAQSTGILHLRLASSLPVVAVPMFSPCQVSFGNLSLRCFCVYLEFALLLRSDVPSLRALGCLGDFPQQVVCPLGLSCQSFPSCGHWFGIFRGCELVWQPLCQSLAGPCGLAYAGDCLAASWSGPLPEFGLQASFLGLL